MLTYYFVGGPRDGEKHRAPAGISRVDIQLERDPDSLYVPTPVDTYKEGMIGSYKRIGNLLIWEGWRS